MMGRIWLVALAVVLARYAGSKHDGIMAAVAGAGSLHRLLPDVVRHSRGAAAGQRLTAPRSAEHVMNAAEQTTKTQGMSKKQILLALGGVWIGGIVVLFAIFGSGGRNNAYQPQNEFKLDNWVHLGIFSINKAVMYLFLAAIATCASMIYIASRMQARPNKVQTAVEALYQLMRDNITGGNLDEKMAKRWFPFIGTLFLFIMFSNLVGYIPLPTNTEHKIDVLRAAHPRRSPCTRRPRTSRSRLCWRSWCSSPTPSKASARRARSATSKGSSPAASPAGWPCSSSASRCSRTSCG
jgi:hypothetical protein